VEHVIFDGLSLLSAPGRVMSPRPASERVVAAAVARLGGRRARVADVGTGSGALAVAIARACPDVEVWATDTSRCAVLLARANVRAHGLEDRVDLWVEPFEAVFAPGDGLEPYRRLADAARSWLAPDGELLVQLHRRPLAVARAELVDFGLALAG
jgi:release factor glutamine methyltransferase